MISKKRMKEIYTYVSNNGEEAAADFFDIGKPSVRRYVNLYKEKFEDVFAPEDKIIVNSDEVQTEEQARNFAQVSDAYDTHRIDLNFRPDGTSQYKIAFVPKKGASSVSFKDVEEKYRDLFSNYVNPSPPKFKYIPSKLLLTVSLFDFHHGKQIYGAEAGTCDYGIKESQHEFSKYMAYVLNVINYFPEHRLDEIVLEIGGDWFNSNSSENATKKGTPQSEDARFIETEQTAESMVTDAVNLLSPYANKIRIVVVPGNHDPDRVIVFAHFLHAWFRNCPQIIVDHTPMAHKVLWHDKVLLMYTHKYIANLVNMMSHLCPDGFVKATTKIINVGHLHTKKDMIITSEYDGTVQIVQHPSLIPGDSWSIENMYLSKRQGMIKLFDTSLGQIAEFNYEPHFIKI